MNQIKKLEWEKRYDDLEIGRTRSMAYWAFKDGMLKIYYLGKIIWYEKFPSQSAAKAAAQNFLWSLLSQ